MLQQWIGFVLAGSAPIAVDLSRLPKPLQPLHGPVRPPLSPQGRVGGYHETDRLLLIVNVRPLVLQEERLEAGVLWREP